MLDTETATQSIAYYAVPQRGAMRLYKRVGLGDFPTPTGTQDAPQPTFGVLSTDQRQVACIIRFPRAPYTRLLVWDLSSGKKLAEIRPEDANRTIQWCGWDAEGRLWHDETHYDQGVREVLLDVVRDDLRQPTHAVRADLHGKERDIAVPQDYFEHARAYAAILYGMGFSPPLGMEQGIPAFDLGIYFGNSTGAVSMDGEYAAAEVRQRSGERRFVVLQHDKKVGYVNLPRNSMIHQCDVVPGLLAITTEERGSRMVRLWALPSLRAAGSVPGTLVIAPASHFVPPQIPN